MKHLAKILFTIISLLTFSSCARTVDVPTVSYANSSNDYIYNVQLIWDDKQFLWIKRSMNPYKDGGGYGGFSIPNFNPFSTIRVNYSNIDGKRIEQSFEIKKSDFKDYKKFSGFRGRVYIYFYQDHAAIDFFEEGQGYLANKKENRMPVTKGAKERIDHTKALTPKQISEVNKVYGGNYNPPVPMPHVASNHPDWQKWSKAQDLFRKYFKENANKRHEEAKEKFGFSD